MASVPIQTQTLDSYWIGALGRRQVTVVSVSNHGLDELWIKGAHTMLSTSPPLYMFIEHRQSTAGVVIACMTYHPLLALEPHCAILFFV